jgi:hypothetical protein
MEFRPIAAVLFAVVTSFSGLIHPNSAASSQAPSCEASPLISATPRRDPNADPFGEGPWCINERRTVWAGWNAGRWHAGRNKALWISTGRHRAEDRRRAP